MFPVVVLALFSLHASMWRMNEAGMRTGETYLAQEGQDTGVWKGRMLLHVYSEDSRQILSRSHLKLRLKWIFFLRCLSVHWWEEGDPA